MRSPDNQQNFSILE